MITKELLNKNRVLTMSNNRKCDYLIVDFGRNTGSSSLNVVMMGINTQGSTKDILVLKTFVSNSYKELVEEAYWICTEFNIQIVLVDCLDFGQGFIDMFNSMISDHIVSIRGINIMTPETKELYQSAYSEIKKDLQYGNLRFLQTSDLAIHTYQKSFLGYSNIMKYHKETDELIDEIANIKLEVVANKTVKLNRFDENIDKVKAMCLFMYYSYPQNCVINQNDDNEKYNITKRMSQYEVIHGTFYKYMFKSIEIEKIQTIFFCCDRSKLEQFKNIIQENEFKELFMPYVQKISIQKDAIDIYFLNDSSIRFKIANDYARGYKCHFIVVDTDVDYEIYQNVIVCKSVMFDIAKRDGLFTDNYNIEFIKM